MTRVCVVCESEFEAKGTAKSCPACIAAEKKRLEEWRRKKGRGRRAPNDPQHLADMVREAREARSSMRCRNTFPCRTTWRMHGWSA